MTSVRLEHVEKSYGQSAVAQIDRLEIADGEILTLLGPSGCGKTTTLRIIAGLIQHDRGAKGIEREAVCFSRHRGRDRSPDPFQLRRIDE